MAFVLKDLVGEYSITTGTGAYTLNGTNIFRHRIFDDVMADADTTIYVVRMGNEFEVVYGGVFTASGTTLSRPTILASSNGGSAVNWGGGTKEIYMGFPAGLFLHDVALTLSATQQAQARADMFAAPFDALAFNGSEVNGGVSVSQELGTTGATLANNTNKYTADMWEAMYNHGAATAVVTSGQVAAASFPAVLPGFSFGHQIKATTAITSPANGDFARHRHQIEGYRAARYGWGATGAFAALVMGKWYSTGAGVAFIRVSNAAGNRAYHREVTLTAGWNTIREIIPGDTSGTWEKTTSAGMIIDFFASGKAASPATPNAWGATPATQTTNSVNLLDTNNDTSIVTGLKVLPVVSTLELPPTDRLPLLLRPYDEELSLCKRYFQDIARGVAANTLATFYTQRAGSVIDCVVKFDVPMRAVPTLIHSSPTWPGAAPGGNNEINNFNNVAAAYTTISGSLTLSFSGGSLIGGRFRMAPGTSFSGTSGDVGNLYVGTQAWLSVTAQL